MLWRLNLVVLLHLKGNSSDFDVIICKMCGLYPVAFCLQYDWVFLENCNTPCVRALGKEFGAEPRQRTIRCKFCSQPCLLHLYVICSSGALASELWRWQYTHVHEHTGQLLEETHSSSKACGKHGGRTQAKHIVRVLFSWAREPMRWIWDQWEPLKTTESSDFKKQEHTLLCMKQKGQRTSWWGRGSFSHPCPCIPTYWPGTIWPFTCTDKNPCNLAISLKPAELFREQGNNTALQ